MTFTVVQVEKYRSNSFPIFKSVINASIPACFRREKNVKIYLFFIEQQTHLTVVNDADNVSLNFFEWTSEAVIASISIEGEKGTITILET